MRVEKFSEKKKLEILDLEKQIGIELVAYERPPNCYAGEPDSKWYVMFKHSDIKRAGKFLVGVHGNGASVNDAIINYCKVISGKTLVIDALSPDKRVEIFVPNLKHTAIVMDDGEVITETIRDNIFFGAFPEKPEGGNYFTENFDKKLAEIRQEHLSEYLRWWHGILKRTDHE